MRWSELGTDPNAPEVLAARQQQLDRAWTDERRDRTEVLEALCTGRRVLDVGCVAHDAARMDSSAWLHGQLVAVASECVGVDFDREGLDRLAARGYAVRHADVTASADQLADLEAFDVVVAGEVIEHLSCPQRLLEFARPLLVPAGILVLTTPNPYAPWRVRAGQLGVVWENADHVVYAFPAGMAELCNRTGFDLLSISSVGQPFSSRLGRSVKVLVAAAVQRGKGDRSPRPIGRLAMPLRNEYLTPVDWAISRWRRSSMRTGETAIYVLRRLE